MVAKFKAANDVGFIPDYISKTIYIAPGVSGDLVTITPPAGKRAALLYLSVNSINLQSGISVMMGSEIIVDQAAIGYGAINTMEHANRFGVGPGISSAVISILIGKQDAQIKINKNAGNTSELIFYAFAYGD